MPFRSIATVTWFIGPSDFGAVPSPLPVGFSRNGVGATAIEHRASLVGFTTSNGVPCGVVVRADGTFAPVRLDALQAVEPTKAELYADMVADLPRPLRDLAGG